MLFFVDNFASRETKWWRVDSAPVIEGWHDTMKVALVSFLGTCECFGKALTIPIHQILYAAHIVCL